MPRGHVKWFNETKGFGWISHEDGDDVFVHYTGLGEAQRHMPLQSGLRVIFEVLKGPRGCYAANVQSEPA